MAALRSAPGRRVRRVVSTAAFAVALIPPLGFTPSAGAVPTELFFSEYVEGTSNNKALEIFNGTGAAVNLSAGGYNVQMFFNGSTSAGLTINLTGTVTNGDVHVLAQSSASAAVLAVADQVNGSGWYNGDDAVVLRKGTTVIDAIGQVGVDPGTEWGTGLTSTMDNSLRRKRTIQAGDPNAADPFDPAAQWDGFVTNNVGGLGTHSIANVTLVPGDILVADASAKVFRVDPSTGAQTVVSSGGNLVAPYATAIDPQGRILVADRSCCGGTGGVIRVEPSTGAQTVVSSGGGFVDPSGVAVEASGKLLVADFGADAVFRVDASTGAKAILASGGFLDTPSHVAVEKNGSILVADVHCCGGAQGGVIRVDPATGAQTVLASGGSFLSAFGVALEPAGEILVSDQFCCGGGQGGVIRVDPVGGAQTVVTSDGDLGGPRDLDTVTPGIQGLTIDGVGDANGSGDAVVSGTIRCSAPETWRVAVFVTQASTGARGKALDSGACTGTADVWRVTASNGAGPAFAPGTAKVSAAGGLLMAGELRDTRNAKVAVTLT